MNQEGSNRSSPADSGRVVDSSHLTGTVRVMRRAEIEQLIQDKKNLEKRLSDLVQVAIAEQKKAKFLEQQLAEARAEVQTLKLLKDKTVSKSSLLQSGGFMGALDHFHPMELIQMLYSGQRTGVLEVTHQDNVGRFWFDRGNIVDAQAGGKTGEDALRVLAGCVGGFFVFQPVNDALLRTHTIERPIPVLLLEISHKLDEPKPGIQADSAR